MLALPRHFARLTSHGAGPYNPAMTADHERWMREALAEAAKAESAGDVPVGAVVVSAGGGILARGHNAREADNDPTAHAEIIALRAAAGKLGTWRLTGAHLYVTLEPCAMCAGAIVLSRIQGVVYGATDPKAGACGSVLDVPGCTALNHEAAVTSGVLAEECGRILKHFFAIRRKRS